MNLQDAWAIDQHIDFDCHHKQLNFSCSASIQAPTISTSPPPHTNTHNKCTQAYSTWMQGHQRRVSHQLLFFLFFFPDQRTLLCSLRIKHIHCMKTIWFYPTTPFSLTELMRQCWGWHLSPQHGLHSLKTLQLFWHAFIKQFCPMAGSETPTTGI